MIIIAHLGLLAMAHSVADRRMPLENKFNQARGSHRLRIDHRPLNYRQGVQGGHGHFIIYEDETSEDHIELSPSVERYRKERRPQRQRYGSYWDKDVLPGLKDLPNEMDKEKDGRRVLGDLPQRFLGIQIAKFALTHVGRDPQVRLEETLDYRHLESPIL
ncbi:MAG: hypothetical protein Q9184_004045 [Pyrenodesmia sp. 2 TL-2023]